MRGAIPHRSLRWRRTPWASPQRRPDRNSFAVRLNRDVPSAVPDRDAWAIARLCAMLPLGDVQRHLQRCLLGAAAPLCYRRDVNTSHLHTLLPRLPPAEPEKQDHEGRADEPSSGAKAAVLRRCPRSRIPAPGRPCKSVIRLPDTSRGRKRNQGPDRNSFAVRLNRDVPSAVPDRDVWAIARRSAMGPLGDVQRNLQRCLLGATNTTYGSLYF